ncbi:hypothetical protein TrST_g10092 [Triparma strigata]|uniref:Ion transport domain-containing protein n=1 Tax=Triparma strigata TaxID=1606541 RepID=A0A9W7AB64_9STRA|nr:hypothetical protein TrST_g10092 [Triparma strigata]
MGKFAALASQIQNPSNRDAGMIAVRDKAGPKTNITAEVGINELAVYQEPGILTEIIKILSSPGPSREAAADCCFRMSRDNTVKVAMSQNNELLTGLAALLKSEPGTPYATNALLCLQNVSFPADTRETLMNAANGVIVEAISHVISSPVDAAHKKPRETAMAVLSNMGITPACKKGLFEYRGGELLKSLIGVLEKGDGDENNVLAMEKALTVCKNLANHKDTKLPMFKFPLLLPNLTKVITKAVSKSATHKEIALQVLQNLANHNDTPMMFLESPGLVTGIINVVAGDDFDGVNDKARTNAWLILQNISFIEECRAKLFHYPGTFDALAGVLDNKEDNVKKNALPVCLNISLATSIRKSMFDHSTFIPSLMTIAKNEDGLVREKALSIMRNVANHEDTKTPMFDFPGLIGSLMFVIKKPLTAESKLARETALAVCQNIANNNINPIKLLNHPGFMMTLYDVFREEATEMNQIARQNALLICQNLSFPNTTRHLLFAFADGKVFDAMLNVMSNVKNALNATAAEKALATIANMSNKKENNLPMAQNTKFLSKLIEYCKLDGEKKRHGINILAKIAAGAINTAPYLLKAPGNVLQVMMGVVKDAGEDLKKWKKGNSNEFWALTFLMNLAQAEYSVKYMVKANMVGLMEPLVKQTSKECLQAAITVAYLVSADKDGSMFELLSSNTASLDRLIALLENTLNCEGDGKGAGGKNTEYGYGVFPLTLPLRAIHMLGKDVRFHEYLLEAGTYQKLHRAFRDFVEDIGGGYVGGGGKDAESAMLALDTLLRLTGGTESDSLKKGGEIKDKKAALNLVESYSAAGMTPLHQLLEQYKLDRTLRDFVKAPSDTASGGQSANVDFEFEALDAVDALLKLSYPSNQLMKGHTDTTRDFAINGDGSRIVSGSDDKTLKLWDVKLGETLKSFEGHRREVFGVAITKAGDTIVSGSLDKTCRIWNAETGAETKKIAVGARVDSVAISADEKSFFAGDGKGRVTQFNIVTGDKIRVFEGHTGYVVSIAVASDGSRIVTGSKDNLVIVWDIKTGRQLFKLEGHTKWVQCVALTPDTKRLISGSWDNTIKIWSMRDGRLVDTFGGHHGGVMAVELHPSGNFVALGCGDGKRKMLSLLSKKYIFTSEEEKHDSIWSIGFSPDGNYMLSGENSGDIHMEYVASQTHMLPSFVHAHYFKGDCRNEDVNAESFHWKKSDTFTALKESPRRILEPRFDDSSEWNLIHAAAAGGRSNFLTRVLNVADDGSVDHSHGKKLGWASRQKLAFFASVFRDGKGQTPLALAVNAESGPSIKTLFDCYSKLLSQQYAYPFYESMDSQAPHPTELFPLDELCRALEHFPTLALQFVGKLEFVSSGDHLVQKGVTRHEINVDSGCLVTGSKTRVPHGLWYNLFHKEGVETMEQGNRVEAKFIPIKDIAGPKSDFLGSLSHAAAVSGKYATFENEIVKTVIQHKWETYVRRMFMKSLFLDIAMVIFLTADVLFHDSGSDDGTLGTIIGWCLTIPTLLLWTYFARDEFRQLIVAGAAREHFTDFWNVLDFLSLISIAIAYALRFIGEEGWSVPWFATALPLAYLNTLYFMQGFEESGQLVRMILGIMKGILVFLIILIVCVIGFAFSFYILYRQGKGEYNSAGAGGEDVVDEPFGMTSPWMSLFSGFLLLLGDFNAEEFNASLSYNLTMALFVVFMFFINIVMLNLLIAIMGDIFDRIQENAKAEFMFARAGIVLEFEAMLSNYDRQNEEWFPTWLQVLVPTQGAEGTEGGDWVGRVKALKVSLDSVKTEVSDDLKNTRNDLKEELDASRAEVKILKTLLVDNEQQNKKLEVMMDALIEKFNLAQKVVEVPLAPPPPPPKKKEVTSDDEDDGIFSDDEEDDSSDEDSSDEEQEQGGAEGKPELKKKKSRLFGW